MSLLYYIRIKGRRDKVFRSIDDLDAYVRSNKFPKSAYIVLKNGEREAGSITIKDFLKIV